MIKPSLRSGDDDLEPVFRAVEGSLTGDGTFVFTVEERPDETGAGTGYRLERHGRYRHDEGYVTATLRRAGLRPDSVRRVVLRRESDEPVRGLLVVAVRSG